MSFDLFVYGEALSLSQREDVDQHLSSRMAEVGLVGEWHPDFDMTAPFIEASIPFKLRVRPEIVAEAPHYGDEPLLAYLHMMQAKNSKLSALKEVPWRHKSTVMAASTRYTFSTSSGRDAIAFRLQTTFAMVLSLALRGVLQDPQSREAWFSPGDVVAHCLIHAQAFDMSEAKDNRGLWDLPRFEGWPDFEVMRA